MPPEQEDKTPISADDLAGIDTSDLDAGDGDAGDAPSGDDKGGDVPVADKGGDAPAGKDGKQPAADGKDAGNKADKGGDKKPAARGAFDLDDDDDDAADGADGKKPDGKKAEDDKSSDDEDGDEKDKKAEAGDWREKIVDQITSKLEDSMSAAKLKKQRSAIMNQLKRLKSPEDAIIAGLAAKQKLAEGSHKELFPVDATDEEKAERRKELGLPETADDYKIPNVPGHEWQPDDDARLGNFRSEAHELGLSQDHVNRLVGWHVRQAREEEEAMEETMASGDAADRDAVHDQIRLEVGVSEFKPHMKVMDRLMTKAFGDEGKRLLTSARFYDPEQKRWRLLSNMPEFTTGIGELARSVYGDGPHVTPDQKVSLNNEKAEIEKLRKEDNDAYYRADSKTGKSPADRLLEINQEEERRTNRYK